MNNIDQPKVNPIEEKIKDGVDNQDLIDLTAQVKDANFCENFADQLKTQESNVVNAIKICVNKCNSDVQIQTLQDFLKSLEDKSGDYADLKAVLKAKIDEYNTPDKNETPANTVVVDDLQTQVDKIYQENGIEKEDAQKILDYISTNKDNPAFITFMDGLIKKNTDGIKITFDKRNGYIGTAEDFAKKVEGIGLPKIDLKPKEKTVDKSTTTIDNTKTGATNTGTINTAPKNINFTTEIPKLKKEIEAGLVDGTTFLDFAKNSTAIQNKIKTHPKYKEITDDVAKITNVKEVRNVMIKGIELTSDILKDPEVKKDIENQLQKNPNNKITFDLIKQDHDYITTVIQNLDKSVQSMTPKQFEEAIKNNTLGNASGVKDITTKDYNFILSTEINDIKTNNPALIKSGKELLTKLTSAKTQGEINTILDNFIKTGDANDNIKNDPNRSKLKTALEKKQSIPKEDVEFIINSIQNGDLDFVTAKIEANKKKTEVQEKLNKEQGQKDLKSYLSAPLEGKSQSKDKNGEFIDNITIVGEGLFENSKLAYDQLFDEKIRTELSPAEQKNLTKIIFAYLDQDFSENDSLNDLEFKTIKKGENSSYPEGTNIITLLKTDPSVQIAFGSYDHVQELKTNIVPDSEITRFKDVLKNAPETIFLELANKGSYMLLKKVLDSYTDQSEKISVLNNLINKDIVGSIKNATEKALPDSKDPNFENQKLLTKQSGVQQEGYINVIRDQVGSVLKTVPKLGEASPAIDLFQSYIKQCEKNPTYLGSDIQTRMNNHNNLVGIRKTLLDKDQNYTMKISTLSENELKGDPYALRDKNINTMIQNLYKGGLKEYNEKYGIKAQLEGLFGQFKDEIMMIAEFLGFDKEDALHRFGMNKSMQDAVNAAYEKAYKLDSGDKAVITKMHDTKSDYIIKITEVSAKIKDDKGEYTQDSKLILSTFKENISGKYFVNTLKQSGANDANVDRSLVSGLLASYNKDKSSTDQIKYTLGDNPDKVNPGWEEVIEKAWNDPLIRNTIKENSDLLEGMAGQQKNGKDMRDSKFTEAASYTIQELGSNPMEAVSYYLSTMILAGSKDLKYKISENNNNTVETPPNTTENKESLSKTLGIKADYIDTAKTTDTKITLSNKANPVSINAIFDDFAKAPAGLKINGQDYSQKGNTYVDAKNNPVKIKEGTTIESMEADKLADLIVSNTIEEVTKSSKTTKAPQDNYDKATNKDYGEKVIKPIFDLFLAENTYKSLLRRTPADGTIKDQNTLKFMLQYSTKDNPAAGSAEENHNKAVTDIIAQIKSDSKVSFEQNVDKTAIVAVIKDKEDKVTAKREIGQGFTLKNTSEQVKSPEKTPTTVDYTSIDAFRKSLGYTGTEIPTDYDKKLEAEFIKDGLTAQQQETIAKEIVRFNTKSYIDAQAKNGIKIDIKAAVAGTTLRGGDVSSIGKLKGDVKKIDDTKATITISGGKPDQFNVDTTIDEIGKRIA